MEQHSSLSNPPRRLVTTANGRPAIYRLREGAVVVPVTGRDLQIMATRRVRLAASQPPIDLDGEDGPPWEAA